jgi:hypothetical protein
MDLFKLRLDLTVADFATLNFQLATRTGPIGAVLAAFDALGRSFAPVSSFLCNTGSSIFKVLGTGCVSPVSEPRGSQI